MSLTREICRLHESARRSRNQDQIRKFWEHTERAIREGQIKLRDISVRDLFEGIVQGGAELVRLYAPRKSGGYQHPYNLLESANVVNTSAFTRITGNLIYNHALDVWNLPEFIGDKLVQTIQSNQKQEEFIGVGDVGDVAEVVPEMGEYPMAGLNEIVVTAPKTEKRGFQIGLTQEIIYFDDTGLVEQRATDITRFLRLNKENRIIDMVFGITNPYIYNDSPQDTYQSSGSNINLKTSNALRNYTSLENSEILFEALENPSTGELISTTPNAVVVPGALKHTARAIINATEVTRNTGDNTDSTNQSEFATKSANTLDNYTILSSPHIKKRTSSDSTWLHGDPQRAFAYVENWPLGVEPAPSGHGWAHDVVALYKVKERGVAAVKERLHMVKNTA